MYFMLLFILLGGKAKGDLNYGKHGEEDMLFCSFFFSPLFFFSFLEGGTCLLCTSVWDYFYQSSKSIYPVDASVAQSS